MSEFRRKLMQTVDSGEIFDPRLVFYSPLTYNDFEEKLTGSQWQITGDGIVEWDSNLGIYEITTPTTTYKTCMKMAFDWTGKFPDNEITVLAEVCRYNKSSIANNNCRPLVGGDGTISPEENPQIWFGGTSTGAAQGYNVVYNYGCATKYLPAQRRAYFNTIFNTVRADNTYRDSRNPDYGTLADMYEPVRSWITIGSAGHRNYRQAHYGIRNIRIYNTYMSLNEMFEKLNSRNT